MKAVIQRVSGASVKVNEKITGHIKKGLLVLMAVHENDTIEEMRWIANKIIKLRIFEDSNGKMNRSVEDVDGEILLVSQFTLYGDVKKGTRPSFTSSAPPEKAEAMYEEMIKYYDEAIPGKVQTGIFGAKMEVSLINDGPVTIILEKLSKK